MGDSNISQSGTKILIVDDEPTILEIGKMVLENEGYSVQTALSGEDAIELCESEEDIALILLDLSLPGIAGKKLLEELMDLCPDAEVILASGYDVSGEATEMLEMGACRFIPKPFHMNDLIKTVSEVLES